MNERRLRLALCWTKEETSLFLKIVRNYPVLYDQNHPSYGLQAVRTKIYTQISDEMKAFKPDVTPEIVRKKFKILKSQYFIERKLKEDYRMKHKATDAPYKPKLWCYDLMNFFEEQKKCERDVEMLAHILLNENDDSIEVEIETQDGIFDQKNTPNKTASRNNLNAKCLQLVNDLESTFRAVKEEREKEDEISMEQSPQTFLGLMIESELSKVNEEIYDEAKWKIIRILQEASKKHRPTKNVPQLKATPPSVMRHKQQTSNGQNYLGNGKLMMIKGVGIPNSTITKFDSIAGNCIRRNK